MCTFFSQHEKDERALRKEISFTITNIKGVRVGLFTPDMAFEVITRNQIEQLVSPSLKCVDMVSSELLTVVKTCAEGVCELILLLPIEGRVIVEVFLP